MKQGAIITGGLTNWQILQQEDGFGQVKVCGWFFVAGLPGDTPMQVKIRVVREADSADVLPWAPCTVDGLNFHAVLRIPAGGLYRLETQLEYEGTNGLSVTRGDMVHHFGVGDVFLIAGQSNAAGRFKGEVLDPPELGVHLLRPGNVWDLAAHPLHETTQAVLTPEMENNNPAHSPFLAFAKELRAALGYPIGLIPLAKGGSGLWQWNPDEEGGLYRQMLQVVRACAPRVKAVLWHQGCADSFEKKGDTYRARFGRMVEAWREDLRQPDLPFLTCQLNRCTLETSDVLDASWGKVREAQRQTALALHGVYMVPTNDLTIFDAVHLDGGSNLRLGQRMAQMALGALYGKGTVWEAPAPIEAVRESAAQVLLRLTNAEAPLALPADAEKAAFAIQDAEGLLPCTGCTARADGLHITFTRPVAAPAVLHGLWQMNPAQPPIDEATGLPLVSFYGLEVKQA